MASGLGLARGPLIDPFGRRVSYLRISVTDRCDFRCTYCMAETMTFLPKSDLLTLEELEQVARLFIDRGTRKIRITGGEPLVRRNVLDLIRALGRRLPHKGGDGALQELTLTTNGSQLARFAEELYAAGMRRINVSMDSLDPDRFKTLTRRGDLAQVQDGIGAALAAGLSVKVNAVALRGINDDEIDDLMAWCGERGCDLTFIETMPMGQIEGGRADPYLPLTEVRAQLQRHWTLTESDHVTGGPARYWDCAQTGRRVGFITPLTHNFCESCNRVRLTCTGMLYMCLGQEDRKDLRAVMRDPALRTADDRYQALTEALDEAVSRKPKGHDFVIDRANDGPAVPRHMSVTGG